MCFRAITRAFTPPAPRMPPPPQGVEAQPIVQQLDAVDTAAQEQERDRARRARGRAAALLTGGQGDTTVPELARPTASAARLLLG
jgi:hypothetical protein